MPQFSNKHLQGEGFTTLRREHGSSTLLLLHCYCIVACCRFCKCYRSNSRYDSLACSTLSSIHTHTNKHMCFLFHFSAIRMNGTLIIYGNVNMFLLKHVFVFLWQVLWSEFVCCLFGAFLEIRSINDLFFLCCYVTSEFDSWDFLGSICIRIQLRWFTWPCQLGKLEPKILCMHVWRNSVSCQHYQEKGREKQKFDTLDQGLQTCERYSC